MWKFFIPIQLANLQVAFEIDDDLYEVHRVTRDLMMLEIYCPRVLWVMDWACI